MAEILANCDTLPGGFIILSKYQEQGIYHLENWHQTNQQHMVKELISSGYLDSDCEYETSDDESSDGSDAISFDGEVSSNGDGSVPCDDEAEFSQLVPPNATHDEEEETMKKCHILERCSFRIQKRISPLYELLCKVALATTLSPICASASIHHYRYVIANTFRVSLY
eukprot:145104_1